MFVKTMKFTRKKAVLILLSAAIILAVIVLIAGNASKTASGPVLKTNSDRLMFFEKLGFEVEETPLEEKEIIIPTEFDAVFGAYNELQKKQGYDLSRFSGMSVMVYTYRVTNYQASGEVYAILYTHNDKVVGGDIHSAEQNGFMHGLK